MTCLRHVVCLSASIIAASPALASAGSRQIACFFEPNAGQADARARFLMRTGTGTVFFTGSEVAVTAPDASPSRILFVGSDPAARIEDAEPRPGTVNYFIGSDPRQWRSALPRYAEVRYSGLYPGVDLSYSAEGRPTNFPVHDAYQPAYGGQVDVFVTRFGRDGDLLSSTYLGGSNSDVGYGIAAYRAAGSPATGIHLSGLTISEDFPVVNPLQSSLGGFEDPFVARLNLAANALLFSTYLGGTDGREEWGATGIAWTARAAPTSRAGPRPRTSPSRTRTSRPSTAATTSS
jgi:hypothetical protein